MRWWLVLLVLVCVAASVPPLLLSDNRFVAYAIGAFNASIVWMVALFTIEVTGTSSWRMGAMAEEWTAEELRPIERRAARVVHAIGLEWGDVDHVVVAPSGVHALESKWSSAVWSKRDLRSDGRLVAAVHQARKNARQVRLRVMASYRPVEVSPVVVIWGQTDLDDVVHVDDVPVVHGTVLRAWLEGRTAAALSASEIDEVHGALTSYVAKRDVGEARTHAPSRYVDVGASGVVGDVGAGVAGGIAGFIVGGLVLGLSMALWARVSLVSALVLVGAVCRHAPVERVRVAALGVAVGGAVVLALVGGVVAFDWMS